MAAKVAMVAVPAVLGIASIRVYTVSETAADGRVTREKLNIYSPLPQSAQVQFVPENPGAVESGLTTAREAIQPFVHAVKSVCVSVKRGSSNLYYAGEDVYYYLKDPPPGFLPRFGTITMAGLLGMVLARKGSRFKQLAVPLGLMSAGVSVCYPAQAVAVFKVTGRKVYAAGQWSSAAVSSLLASKPQEPVAKESATVPHPESVVEETSELRFTTDTSAQSAATPEPEVELAKSVPFSNEPSVAVVTDEAPSVTLADKSPDQAPTETDTDSVIHSVPSETENTTTSDELPEKPSDIKQAPEEASVEASSGSSAGSEPETVTSAESAPSSEDSPVPTASDAPAVPVVESAEPEPAGHPPAAAVGETPSPTTTPPKPPEEGTRRGGSGFKPDPSLMDFGQSSPEDEDLYTTRS